MKYYELDLCTAIQMKVKKSYRCLIFWFVFYFKTHTFRINKQFRLTYISGPTFYTGLCSHSNPLFSYFHSSVLKIPIKNEPRRLFMFGTRISKAMFHTYCQTRAVSGPSVIN